MIDPFVASLCSLNRVFPRGVARALCLLPLVVATFSLQTADAATSTFVTAAQSAAQSRAVPLPVVEAIAYVNTRWEWINTPAMNGGIGPMNITPEETPLASSLSGHSQAQISSDLAANLDAGAALLAHYHTSGTDLASWQPAVVTTQGPYVARQIFDALQAGASRTLSTGETVTLAPQAAGNRTGGASSVNSAATAAACTPSPDYGSPACWIPAYSGNFSIANRAHDYPIDMIVIHDIEGSYGSAIQTFQTPGREASAHYVVSYGGDVTQMVREHDIAWHAGNWDYNTRAIGIEHEGFAWTPGLYTNAEYNASAQIAASICSRWGVQLDRAHVIGHNEVPDPNNPNLTGGSSHHTDPGPYWNWTYYMQQAQTDAATLPSPPHMMPDPVATSTDTNATVTWKPARTCRPAAVPITGYTVTLQPGGQTQTLPATATSATFTGLNIGASYTFTVTATDADGQDSAPSNAIIVGACTTSTPLFTSYLSWFDRATAGMVGDNIHLLNPGSSTSLGCLRLGSRMIPFSLGAGAETHLSFPKGTIGGPVVVEVTHGPALLASQRVQYFTSFNEVWAMSAAQAAQVSYLSWFDRSTAGMVGDNIHVINPGTATANGTVSLPGATPVNFSLAPGAETHVSFPAGKIGGPVKISADQPVLASQRVQYYQSFNEVVARSAAQAAPISYFNWFDRATAGMVGDNIHLLNPDPSATAHLTVTLPGASPIAVTLGPGAQTHVSFPKGKIGGPVKVSSDVAVLAWQRVQYYRSFNEVGSESPGQALATSHLMWFDRATAGMVGDNIHVLNPGTTTASVQVKLGASSLSFSLGPGAETHVSFPAGKIGGPVSIISTLPVLAAQRVQYFQTFNEVDAG